MLIRGLTALLGDVHAPRDELGLRLCGFGRRADALSAWCPFLRSTGLVSVLLLLSFLCFSGSRAREVCLTPGFDVVVFRGASDCGRPSVGCSRLRGPARFGGRRWRVGCTRVGCGRRCWQRLAPVEHHRTRLGSRPGHRRRGVCRSRQSVPGRVLFRFRPSARSSQDLDWRPRELGSRGVGRRGRRHRFRLPSCRLRLGRGIRFAGAWRLGRTRSSRRSSRVHRRRRDGRQRVGDRRRCCSCGGGLRLGVCPCISRRNRSYRVGP